jgi:hypothetical protein
MQRLMPLTFTLSLIALAPVASAQADPRLPDLSAADFSAAVANPWFPLTPGHVARYATVNRFGAPLEDGERSVTRVEGPGPVIMGVQTVAVLDEAWEGDHVVERTTDYFATDSAGNLWYFGEDVENFTYNDEDMLIRTDADGTWRAGVDGAMPGIAIPGAPAVGDSFYQEHAPANDAMDYAEVVAVNLTLDGRTGVLQLADLSAIDSDHREFKYFAPGIGLLRAEEELDAGNVPGTVVAYKP